MDYISINKNGKIAEIILNRKEAYNAFNIEIISQLANLLTQLACDDTVKGIIITGSGNSFCAGGDLKWAIGYSQKTGTALHALASQFHLAIVEIRRMKKPVIAAINGAAAGGGFSLALACDFRVMEESAKFKQAYTSNGLCIDGGGTFTLPRIVGLARALEIVAFDQPIPARQALEWGLVNKVVKDGTSMEESRTLLNQMKCSLHSFGLSKKLLNDSFGNSFEYQLESEREGLSACGNHPDGQEGLKAFVEKRKPVFER